VKPGAHQGEVQAGPRSGDHASYRMRRTTVTTIGERPRPAPRIGG
jgi:hypothetical protein